jgi:hypothetical protein
MTDVAPQPTSSKPRLLYVSKIKKSIPARIYLAGLGLSTLYGAIKGLSNWENWLQTRKELDISHEIYGPIINSGRDGVYLGINVSSSALIGFGTALFMPIILPYSIFTCKEKIIDTNL